MRHFAITVIAMFAASSHAAIYVNQTSGGGTEYTDTPSEHSTKADVPEVNTITSVQPAATTAQPANANEMGAAGAASTSKSGNANAEQVSTASTYKTFEIASPKNEETIQNQPVISVSFNIDPVMLPGDKIQLMLDGSPVGTPNATIYQEISNVNRGTHTLSAVILNKNGERIKQTTSITIYVHRNTINTSPQGLNKHRTARPLQLIPPQTDA